MVGCTSFMPYSFFKSEEASKPSHSASIFSSQRQPVVLCLTNSVPSENAASVPQKKHLLLAASVQAAWQWSHKHANPSLNLGITKMPLLSRSYMGSKRQELKELMSTVAETQLLQLPVIPIYSKPARQHCQAGIMINEQPLHRVNVLVIIF